MLGTSMAHSYDDEPADADYLAGGGSAGDSDFCSRAGAHALKVKIEAYWRDRGHAVMIALHNVGFHPAIRAARFDVRSDMVNGMPRSAVTGKAPLPPVTLYVDDEEDDLAFE